MTFRHCCNSYFDFLQPLSLHTVTDGHGVEWPRMDSTEKAIQAAAVIRERLHERGIRPKELADALGVHRSTASLMLSGKRGIPPWYFEKIAALLECVPADFFSSQARENHVHLTPQHDGISNGAAGDDGVPIPTEIVYLALIRASNSFRNLGRELSRLAGQLGGQIADASVARSGRAYRDRVGGGRTDRPAKRRKAT